MSTSPIDNQLHRGIALEKQKAKSIDYQQVDDTKFIPQKFKDVAESMESQFAEEMIKQMNQTIDEAGGEDSGMDYYKGLLTTERAKMMANQNNLGLQKVILDQIYPKRMRNELALKQYEQQANLIHQNLPSYKIDTKSDTITKGKNDSTPASDEKSIVRSNSEGGSQ